VVAAVLFEQEDSGHETEPRNWGLSTTVRFFFSFVSLTLASLSYGGE
jgi:hypothetical protein